MKDYYSIMGLQRNATPAQVREKYRFLAKEFHPDKPTGSKMAFQELQEAYEVLSDPKKRRAYDLQSKLKQFPVSPEVLDLIALCRKVATGRVPPVVVEQGAAVLERVLEDRGINAHFVIAEDVMQALGWLKPKRRKRA